MTGQIIPFERDFDREEIRDLLFRHDGNVTEAAGEIRVEPERLRAYVRALPDLMRALDETMDRGVDRAIEILWEALRDNQSFQNRYYAAKEFLRSEAGRRRGFGPRETGASLEVKTTDRQTSITIKWLDPPKEI